MVQKVKRDQEVRARDEATKGANDKVERTKIIEDGVACLQIYVLPMLEQAKSAFESEGISVHIRQNFDVHHYCNVKPSLVFVCAGPSKQNKRGGISEPKSIPAFFSSDGAKIE